jgi:hypothetical protein
VPELGPLGSVRGALSNERPYRDHLVWAERRPALTQAVMAPLICWSFSNSMFKYRLVDHAVPAMCRSLAAARLSADCPSGNEPTTRVRRLISRRSDAIRHYPNARRRARADG